MTSIRILIATAGTAALVAVPFTATAQSPSLPQELAGLDLADVRETGDGDDREIRARLDGTLIEIEYDDGRLKELASEPGAVLPQSVLDAMVPAAVLDRARDMGLGAIVEVEFDDDGEIELLGTDTDGPVEATFATSGQMLEFERREEARRGPPSHAIRHDLSEDDVRGIAADADYESVEWIEIRPKHVEFDATNAEGETVQVRLNEDGRVVREERR